jgi:glycosyltransferase involved in cell wall biosynthesis
MADDTSGITVLIPTYNRAKVLRETLEALTRVDRTGIDCSIVIVDNNSTDNTHEIATEYAVKLPISYLKEVRPGKNCALNKALRECELKDIVVFTDDDVTPTPNWLQEIASSVKKWPEIAVFGGKVELIWPDNKQPEWARPEWIMAFGFSRHHYVEGEAFYKAPACPFGPNYWVRKVVFQRVPLFDETLGPKLGSRIQGDETSFLMNLHGQGFPILYYPGAEVYHRILHEGCTIPWLRHRAYTQGRGQVMLHGLHRRNIYRKNKILWCMVLVVDELYTVLRLLTGFVLTDTSRNCEATVNAMMRFGQIHETANQVFKRLLAKNGSTEHRGMLRLARSQRESGRIGSSN